MRPTMCPVCVPPASPSCDATRSSPDVCAGYTKASMSQTFKPLGANQNRAA